MNLTSLNSLSYGIYVIGVKGETYPSASIVNTCISGDFFSCYYSCKYKQQELY